MMGEEGAVVGTGRVTGIRHIVRLREMLQKWQSSTLGSRDQRSDAAAKRLAITACDNKGKGCGSCDAEDDDDQRASLQSPEPPADVPKGYLAVYVGPEHRRFVIPTAYLGLPVFRVLLEKAEEEFGFEHQGAITFPCETETFKYILQCMDKHQRGLIDDEGNPTSFEE